MTARWTATLPDRAVWDIATSALDLLVLKEISNFLLGALLILAACLLLIAPTTRRIGWPLLYLGVVQFLSTTIADLAKPQFGRLRPYEATASPSAGDVWFAGANSFPSGHAAFYAGLFLPLMLLFPRWTLLWATPPIFIAAARVLSHDHYLSDVSASLALACVLTASFTFILRRGRTSPVTPPLDQTVDEARVGQR